MSIAQDTCSNENNISCVQPTSVVEIEVISNIVD